MQRIMANRSDYPANLLRAGYVEKPINIDLNEALDEDERGYHWTRSGTQLFNEMAVHHVDSFLHLRSGVMKGGVNECNGSSRESRSDGDK